MSSVSKSFTAVIPLVIALALAGCASEPPVSDMTEPSVVATPDAESSELDQSLTVEALQIPAGLSAEELGTLVVEDRFTKWDNAGFNDQLVEDWLLFEGDTGPFVTTEAEKQGAVFSEALFVPEWEADSALRTFVEGRKEINATTLENSLKTYDAQQDEEPYYRGLLVNSVTEVSDDGVVRVIDVDFTEYANSGKNRVGEVFAPEAPAIEGLQGTYSITFVLSEDGTAEKIQSIMSVRH